MNALYPFGNERHARTNAMMNETFAKHAFLIAAHRTTPRGDIMDNTLRGLIATERVGGDIAEIDIARSTDGVYFVFHDSFESVRLAHPRNLTELSAAEIEALYYTDVPGTNYGKVERAEYLLGNAPRNLLINVDRSWRYWGEGFLDWLDQFHMEQQLILKSPVAQEHLKSLGEHGVAYPYMAMVADMREVNEPAHNDGINYVGAELQVRTADSPLRDQAVFRAIHELGLFTFVNALDLSNFYSGFAGFDDSTSILRGPDEGWGRILEYGADVIQTDWPEMLFRYRSSLESSQLADAIPGKVAPR